MKEQGKKAFEEMNGEDWDFSMVGGEITYDMHYHIGEAVTMLEGLKKAYEKERDISALIKKEALSLVVNAIEQGHIEEKDGVFTMHPFGSDNGIEVKSL